MVQKGSLWDRLGTLQIPPPYIRLEDRDEVHITDMGSYGNCRRQWDYASRLRRGLQPALLPKPLNFGKAMHVALDMGYHDCIGSGAPAQMNVPLAVGIFQEWMESESLHVIRQTGPLWADEKDVFVEMTELGTDMLKHYGMWVGPLDQGYELLGAEKHFKVPIPGEHDMAYAGIFDGLVRETSTGKIYILEYKTAASLKRMSGTFRSCQTTAYLWAAAQIYGMPIQGMLYRCLLKRAPDWPKPLKTGGFSRAKSVRSSENWYKHCLGKLAQATAAEAAAAPSPDPDTFNTDGYYRQLCRVAAPTLDLLRGRGNEFFLQIKIHRGPAQLANIVRVIRTLGREMLSNPVIFERGGIHCNWCSFTDPCDLETRGLTDAAEALLDAEYVPRTVWEGASKEGGNK